MSNVLYRLAVTFPPAALAVNQWGETVLDPEWVPDTFVPDDVIPKFYWPKTDRLYRSRSAATDRAKLLRYYGCTVTILRADPVWTPYRTLTPELHLLTAQACARTQP
ncbi:MAG: hypothetical protein LKI24_14195 [Acidipropionibacterium sp.]|jgi:hypothetical protein|nr:hypothetical protein [Acidipropionibacterium sp.]